MVRLGLPVLQKELLNSGLKTTDATEDALIFWKNYNKVGANLFVPSARMLLSIPAGAAFSEAAFSQTSRNVSKFRTRLSDESLQMMTVCESFLSLEDEFLFDKFYEKLWTVVEKLVESEPQPKLVQQNVKSFFKPKNVTEISVEDE